MFYIILVDFFFFGVVVEYKFYFGNRICVYDFFFGVGGVMYRNLLGFLLVEGFIVFLVVLYFNFCVIYKVKY